MNLVLLIRHLPSLLDDDKKDDLLKHFGAVHTKIMGTTGSMKHCAFATFPDQESAKRALTRLHQLEICGHRLVVEFAKPLHDDERPHEADDKDTLKIESEVLPSQLSQKSADFSKLTLDDIYAKYGIMHPRHPGLFYLYPPPTVSTLTNIANALAANPKFYVQVLHLMNKLNLPAPFGPPTPTPPIADDSQAPEDAIDMSESEESEIESDPEMRSKASTTAKRTLPRKSRLSSKRPKFIPPPMPAPIREPSYISPAPSDIFDTGNAPIAKQANVSIAPLSLTPAVDSKDTDLPKSTDDQEPMGGFGKIEPLKKDVKEGSEGSGDEFHINPSKFLPLSHIKSGRISTSQMKDFPVFKNYRPGDPCTRLYVKNLSRKVTEEEITNLFGSFANYSTDEGQSMFYVQLMEGRMKGQAFVTLSSEDQAKSAVREVNGYVLHGKPMIVQFARTAKPKD